MRPQRSPLVFLVEDDPAVARAHARLLRRSGLGVEVCGSPVLALKRIAAGERFDVVVSDGRMPELDGVAFFLRALAFWPGLAERIVFLSGGLPDQTRLLVEERRLPFFAKPLGDRRDEFFALIRTLASRGETP